jgi:two-component system sensor histidine kinase PhoQ
VGKILAVNSLRRRILVATSATILFFLILAGVALDNAFQRVIRHNVKVKLQNLTFTLLSSAILDASGHLSIPLQLLPNDVKIPKSGLTALIVDQSGSIEWRSPSSLGENLPLFSSLSPGKTEFEANKGNRRLPFIYRFGTVWGNAQGQDRLFTFIVLESKDAYQTQIKNFRETIIQWLGGGSLLILLFHFILLLRELRPLKRVVQEIDDMEKGVSDHIRGDYPNELALLTRRINQFIRNEREQLVRYRHGLDDLAHSLKTPLAVIRGLQQEGLSGQAQSLQLEEQIMRMTDIIDYQLKRAASAGRATLGTNQTPLWPILNKTLTSLQKVYADKNIEHQINCDTHLAFPGDKDDIYEIIGNVCDNAYKWAKNQVVVGCTLATHDNPPMLTITIEDDGPGFSPASEQNITQRGVRADEQVPGQGIGLAVVQSIVRSYDGELETGTSKFGGALIKLSFPVQV